MEPGCLSQSLDHTVFTKCTRVPVEIRVPAWWSSEQVMGVSEVEGVTVQHTCPSNMC